MMPYSTLRSYRIPLAIVSWLAFAISITFYWITADPGASYWDCPEYVTVASKMEVGHPPGNPIWMITMRVATILFPPQYHAYIINLCSGFFMAFATFFLCRLIFVPCSVWLRKLKNLKGKNENYCNFIAGCVALGSSLCFALCDSAWFSAVEAEVYAMSTFLSAASLWIMMVWWHEISAGRRFRLLILLAYLMGLSLGVHQLNLLLIPVFALVVLYRRHPKRVNPIKTLLIILISIAVIGFILMGLTEGVLFGACKFEIWAVNGLGMPYNTGIIIFTSLILALLLVLITLSYTIKFKSRSITQILYKEGSKESKSTYYHFSVYRLQLILWSAAFLLLGYSSFGMIMIRAQAAPPMNEGSPDNIFALASYISREQYPSTPLIYGHTPYSKPMFEEEIIDGKPFYPRYALKKGKAIYRPVEPDAQLKHRSNLLSHQDSIINNKVIQHVHGYVLTDFNFRQILTPELNMWFPRITSRNAADILSYKDWSGATKETMLRLPISETFDSLGNAVSKMNLSGHRIQQFSYRPTYYQNFKYFVSYQAYYMYFRYLCWNFIGRQNDYPSTGEIEHGNFITGIPYIDSNYLGTTDEMPDEIGVKNPGRNRYFGIPFIFGIIGFFFLAFSGRQNRRLLTIIFVLFLMTGLAIVAFLNQTPGEPRERDYTFLMSYMAFTMWMAAGIMGIFSFFIRKFSLKPALAFLIVSAFGIPTLMAIENFDNNNRHGRFEPTFFASSILDFEYSSIIFSYGDNHTFPFWYATEVLNMGKNHVPVDITYLSVPSYVVNLKKQGYKGLTTIGETSQLAFGKFLLTRIPSDSISVPISLQDAIKVLYSSENAEWPSSLIMIKGKDGKKAVVNLHDFTQGSSYLPFKQLMLLDIIAAQENSQNPKILFFPSTIDRNFYKPLEPLLKTTLFGKIYSPEISDSLNNRMTNVAIKRELFKLADLKNGQSLTGHYADPATNDRTRRYRGELIIAAQELINRGDTTLAVEIADAILNFFPYDELMPGDFTIGDSTYYEGKNFSLLLKNLSEIKSNNLERDNKYSLEASRLDSLMQKRYKQWTRYYHSLPPQQRATLSNRSIRLLKDPAQ